MSTEARRMYNVMIVFEAPQEGSVQVAARDEEHAKELIKEQFKHFVNLRIVDVFDVAALDKFNKERAGLIEDAEYEDITNKPKLILAN